MKDTIKLAIYITIVMLCTSNYSFAQFIMGGTAPNRFAVTDNAPANFNVEAVGIGAFTLINPPLSALHVNTNLLTTTPAFTSGEVFRTTGPSTNVNAWRMFTGAGNGTQTFSITTLANTGGIEITTFQNQPMEFNTNNVLRMHINANFSPSNQGFVGIGTSFSAPQSRLHINEMDPVIPVNGGTACYAQWTVTATGNATANDGLRVGLSGNGTAEIRQQENLPLLFYTNNIETARMLPNTATTLIGNPGMMGLGNFSPTGPNTAAVDVVNAKLDIDGDLRIRTVTQNDALTQVLAIDPTDKNRVHWVDANNFTGGGGGTVTADNGLSIVGPNNVQLGGTLLNTTTILLNGNELNFEGSGRVGIGLGGASMLNVINTGNWVNVFRLANSLNNELLTFSDGKRLSINAVNDPAINIEQAVSINCILDAPTSGATLFGVDIYTKTIDPLNSVLGPRMGTRVIMEGKTDGPSKPIIGLWTAARSQNNDGVSNYIGVLGNADRGTSGENIGVWGTASNTSSSNIGVKGTGLGTGNFGGYFEGDVHVTGAITAVGTITPSDQQFKTNINFLNNATTLLNQLQPKVYNLDSANFTQFGFDTKQHMGLIGQEVELILPNLVSNNVVFAQTDSLGNEITPQLNYKGLNYQELIPLLIAGFQEQQTTLYDKDSVINNLEDRLATLEQCLSENNLCNEGSRTSNNQNNEGKVIELENLNAIILDQNLPNPFAEKTSINYTIPTDVKEAQLLFYDINGRIIKQVDITERGESKLTVYGENLQNGIYSYSLIADGKLIATKKMVKQ